MQPALLLFDIGHVLVKLSGAGIIQRLSRQKLSKAHIWHTWMSIPGVRGFETGRIQVDSFATDVIDFYDLAVSQSEFIEIFRAAAEAKYEGVDDFLGRLSQTLDLACLTNTNPIQWPKIRDDFVLGGFFPRQYVSYELGMVKPDRDIFLHVLNDTGLAADQVFFVDDNIANIETAKQLGFQSCHVVDFADTEVKVGNFLQPTGLLR